MTHDRIDDGTAPLTVHEAPPTDPGWIDADHHLQIVVDDHAFPARMALAGDLDLSGGDAFEAAIRPLAVPGARVEVEVHLLGFVDSSGLAGLLGGANLLREVDGHLVLVDPSDQLLRLLDLTRTRDQFTISSAPARIPMHRQRPD